MSNRMIVVFPDFYAAPDGTLLYPRIGQCGCKLLDFVSGDVKNRKMHFLFESCKEHYEKCIINACGDPKNYTDYRGDLLPIVSLDILE